MSIVAGTIVGELSLVVVVLPLEEEGDEVHLPPFLTATTIDIEFSLSNPPSRFIIDSRRRTQMVTGNRVATLPTRFASGTNVPSSKSHVVSSVCDLPLE